jgi:Bacterial protein of unknown function (DUF937)
MASLLDMLSQQLSPEVVQGMGRQIGADEKQTEQALSALLPMMVGGLAKNTAGNPQGSMKLSQALERDHDGSMLDHITGMLGGAGAQNHPLAGLMGGGNGQQGGGDLLSSLLGNGGQSGGGQSGGEQGSGQSGAGNLLAGLMGGGSGSSSNAGGGAADMLAGLLGGGGGGMANMLAGLLGTAPSSSRASNVTGILGNILGGGNVAPIQQGVSQATGLDSGKIGALMAMLAPMVMGALGKMKRQDGLDSQGLANVLQREQETIQQRVPEASNISKFLDSNRDGKVDMKDDIAKVGMALGGAMLLSQMRKK